MKPIPTKIHGLLDYLTGGVLIVAPALFDFPAQSVAGRLPLLLGVAAVLYSLFTRYEWGLRKVIPMRVHLGLDFMSGLLLAASPWILGFADVLWRPHLFIGLFEISVALLTRSAPSVAFNHPRAVSTHAV